jgi:SAM-dependent methyltransferase
MTGSGREKFDGLGQRYDRYRPRYPAALMDAVVEELSPTAQPRVIDTGAGTGVALEGLVPRLPAGARIDAVDISADMVARGREKFPTAHWHVGPAEPFLEHAHGVDLVLAAQAYQWMDRPRYLRAAAACLATGGLVAIMQNNRDFTVDPFLDAYEALLEELSPGYSRLYRSFDVHAELTEHFNVVRHESVVWKQRMRGEDFAGMSQTSTQAQRAIAAHGEEFARRLSTLIDAHQTDGNVVITYTSEAFTASAPPGVGC